MRLNVAQDLQSIYYSMVQSSSTINIRSTLVYYINLNNLNNNIQIQRNKWTKSRKPAPGNVLMPHTWTCLPVV